MELARGMLEASTGRMGSVLGWWRVQEMLLPPSLSILVCPKEHTESPNISGRRGRGVNPHRGGDVGGTPAEEDGSFRVHPISPLSDVLRQTQRHWASECLQAPRAALAGQPARGGRRRDR